MDFADQIALIENACREYLDLLRSAPSVPRERQERLAAILDRLCAAYNEALDVEPDTVEVDAPRADQKLFGDQAALSFPELGFYPQVDPLENFEQEIKQRLGIGRPW